MYQINKTIILLFTSFVYNISFGQDISLSQLGIPPNTCDTLCSVRFLQNKKITIEYDSITKQKHIGISLFSHETKIMVGVPVCNFLERLSLQLCLLRSTAETNNYLHRKDISIIFNGINYGGTGFTSFTKVIDRLGSPSSFTVSNANKRFKVIFCFGLFNRLEIDFPASRELIFNTDKKEADEYVYAQLLSDETSNAPLPQQTLPAISTLYKDSTGLYVKRGDSFLINSLNKNEYFQTTPQGYLGIVFTSTYPEQSIKNMLAGITQYDPVFHITHRMYGNYTPSFDIQLSKLLSVFSKDFTHYIGSEMLDSNTVQCVVVFYNDIYNYIHMLVFSISRDRIDNITKEPIKADFFSNMPQDNIKCIF